MRIKCSGDESVNLLDALLTRGKAVYLRVGGESMEPTIKDAAVVKIAPIEGKIKNGEIVLYKDSQGKPVIHRVIKIFKQENETHYFIRADNSRQGGEAVERSEILGRVALGMMKNWVFRWETNRRLILLLNRIKVKLCKVSQNYW